MVKLQTREKSINKEEEETRPEKNMQDNPKRLKTDGTQINK